VKPLYPKKSSFWTGYIIQDVTMTEDDFLPWDIVPDYTFYKHYMEAFKVDNGRAASTDRWALHPVSVGRSTVGTSGFFEMTGYATFYSGLTAEQLVAMGFSATAVPEAGGLLAREITGEPGWPSLMPSPGKLRFGQNGVLLSPVSDPWPIWPGPCRTLSDDWEFDGTTSVSYTKNGVVYSD
jgi:hypothetical protein